MGTQYSRSNLKQLFTLLLLFVGLTLAQIIDHHTESKNRPKREKATAFEPIHCLNFTPEDCSCQQSTSDVFEVLG